MGEREGLVDHGDALGDLGAVAEAVHGVAPLAGAAPFLFVSVMKLAAPLLIIGVLIGRPVTVAGQPAAAPLDSALAEMRAGRHWHAATILREIRRKGSDDARALLLLASAEAGWGNWREVARLLTDGRARDAGSEAWLLVARAHEAAGEWEASRTAYRTWLEGARDRSAPDALAASVGLARVSLAMGRAEEAFETLKALRSSSPWLVSWAAVEGARSAAVRGDTTTVVALLSLVRDAAARDAAWGITARAREAAGDTVGAVREYLAARESGSDTRPAEASAEAGRLALAREDSSMARPLLLAGMEAGPLSSRARAAAGLLASRDTDLALTLRLADILDQAGDSGPALRAYDRAARLAAAAGSSLSGGVRVSRARLIATVPSRRQEALDEFRSIRESGPDPLVGARNLELWARLRERQGRTADVATLRKWLLEEYPASAEAAEVMWEEAQAAEDREDVSGALRAYAKLIANAPEHDRAGAARMRTGQIHLARGRAAEAARVFQAYLTEIPRGRRWAEASCWMARALLLSGDTAAARARVAALRAREPISYYSVVGATLVGEAYDLPFATGAGPGAPPWLPEEIARLDILADAGLAEGVEAQEARLIERGQGDPDALLAIAEALVTHGRPISAINLGWELRRIGIPWSIRLLRVLYPLPYREIVLREAAEQGVDPVLVAALIRQESAFLPNVHSPAGAVGLMQVMPSTGRELARRIGPDGFRNGSLEFPDVNAHLGVAFLRDMIRRYQGDLLVVLSAFNAGPARADRWRRWPEVSDPERFVERIPYEETRTYVKNVRRNLELYRLLYDLR